MTKYNAQEQQKVRMFYVKNIRALEEISQGLGYPFYVATDLGGKLREVDIEDYLLDGEDSNGDMVYQLKPKYWGVADARTND